MQICKVQSWLPTAPPPPRSWLTKLSKLATTCARQIGLPPVLTETNQTHWNALTIRHLRPPALERVKKIQEQSKKSEPDLNTHPFFGIPPPPSKFTFNTDILFIYLIKFRKKISFISIWKILYRAMFTTSAVIYVVRCFTPPRCYTVVIWEKW